MNTRTTSWPTRSSCFNGRTEQRSRTISPFMRVNARVNHEVISLMDPARPGTGIHPCTKQSGDDECDSCPSALHSLIAARGPVRGDPPVKVRARLTEFIAAGDPGHARLTVAIAVATGMLASALFGQYVVQKFHADTGLLSMSIFLSVQAGSMVKDRTPRARAATTALLVPALLGVILAASFLLPHRFLVIAGFVLVAGFAIWVRKFGPRAAAIGALSFMGYFFTLFMKPTAAELPVFCLVGAGAVVAQLIVRLVLLLQRPRRELEVLLRELRAGSRAAIHAAAAQAPGDDDHHARHQHPRPLRAVLSRLDDVGRAITTWQQNFSTEDHVAMNAQDFAELVLDARADTEEASFELARVPRPAAGTPATRTEHALLTVLDEHAAQAHVLAARDVAHKILVQSTPASAPEGLDTSDSTPLQPAAYLLAQAAISHARLRDIELTHNVSQQHATSTTSTSATATAAPRPHTSGVSSISATASHRRQLQWLPWQNWAPTTRMAVQTMIAALIATGVGEAISASRWYWAVMTAFVIFIGATTRSSILTRAYRRVAGTAIGIAIGIASVYLAGNNTTALVGICVVAVFGMLYLGPLNYLYSAICITIMLVALYRMLGVLDGSILELRLVETLSGAVIGVLCAYLILSSNSRSVMHDKVDAYFHALRNLLTGIASSSGADATISNDELLGRLTALDTARADTDQAASSMATAFVVRGPHREIDAVHMMYVANRAAARATQSTVRARAQGELNSVTSGHVLQVAVDAVLTTSHLASQTLDGAGPAPNDASPTGESTSQAVIESVSQLPPSSAAVRDVVLALARIEWALERVVENGPGSRSHADAGSRR